MSSIPQLSSIPAPLELKQGLKGCTTLDIILTGGESEFTFEYHPRWSESETLGAWTDGSGNDVKALFIGAMAVIKGFDHESVVSPYQRKDRSLWPGLYDGLPEVLAAGLRDAALTMNEATVCLWWSEDRWQSGPVSFPNGEDNGSAALLPHIQMGPADFVLFADEYYETELELEIVESVFAGATITDEMILALNPNQDLVEVRKRLATLE